LYEINRPRKLRQPSGVGGFVASREDCRSETKESMSME